MRTAHPKHTQLLNVSGMILVPLFLHDFGLLHVVLIGKRGENAGKIVLQEVREVRTGFDYFAGLEQTNNTGPAAKEVEFGVE